MNRSLAHYDKAYFDKWYRHPKHRVKSALDIRRQLGFIVAATEYLLERPVRKVLDAQRARGGAGIRLLTETVTSPTLAQQIRDVLREREDIGRRILCPVRAVQLLDQRVVA